MNIIYKLSSMVIFVSIGLLLFSGIVVISMSFDEKSIGSECQKLGMDYIKRHDEPYCFDKDNGILHPIEVKCEPISSFG